MSSTFSSSSFACPDAVLTAISSLDVDPSTDKSSRRFSSNTFSHWSSSEFSIKVAHISDNSPPTSKAVRCASSTYANTLLQFSMGSNLVANEQWVL
eukprot:CAMPEP_0194209578 /NCGR_PEP_ID=MMETSP0156-20130528/7658_1 /TAXON_ID=33649 /ORGANISM="Thalassionema nitzschioides, Strain L26-B" /LENGTH=95 /DNA_ID=CAMNT_0038936775 /DNA_START=156 /DNA_END=443 /DNA_ORIENTATION=+